MNQVPFLAHGIGVHGEDWSTAVTEQLRPLPGKYGYLWVPATRPPVRPRRDRAITYDGAFTRSW